MNITHIKRLALVFAIQVICLAGGFRWEHTTLNWLAVVFCFCTYILPLVGYITVLYKAPMFEKTNGILKMLCLALLSFFATMGVRW
jgi:hypothetical protein